MKEFLAINHAPRAGKIEKYLSFAELPEGTEIKIAEGNEAIEAAELVYSRYLEQGFTSQNDTHKRITPYHSLGMTRTVVIKSEGVVVSTATIVFGKETSLPCLKRSGRGFEPKSNSAEIISLATAPGYGLLKNNLTLHLFRYFYHYIKSFESIEDVYIAVNPKHSFYYKTVLGFEEEEGLSQELYDFANGAPATVLKSRVKRFPEWVQRSYRNDGFYRFFVGESSNRFEYSC